MAVNLLSASDARIDFGDIAAIGGQTEITVSITFKPSTMSTNRIVGKWGTGHAMLMQGVNTDEIGFVVQGPGPLNTQFFGRQTTDLNVTAGTLYRVVARWKASTPEMQLWVNGVDRTVVEFVGSNPAATSIADNDESLQVGHETSTATDGIDGDYSELAVHFSFMPDDYCVAYGKGYSPRFYRRSGLLYCPMWNVGNLRDLWGANHGTNSSGTSAAHSSIILPSGPQIRRMTTAAAAQVALIQPHVTLQRSQRMIAY